MLPGVCHVPLVIVVNLLKMSNLLVALNQSRVPPHLDWVPLVQDQTVSIVGVARGAVGVATLPLPPGGGAVGLAAVTGVALQGPVRTKRLADYLNVWFC